MNSMDPNRVKDRLSAKFNILASDVEKHPFAGQVYKNIVSQQYAEGGSVPRQTNIAGQDHELSYINAAEKKLLLELGGSGESGPGGIPAYASGTIYWYKIDPSNPGGYLTAIDTGNGSDLNLARTSRPKDGWTEGKPSEAAEGGGTGDPPTDDEQAAADAATAAAEAATAKQTEDLAAARQTQQDKVDKLQLELTKLQSEDQTNPAIVASISTKNEQLLKAQNDLAAIGSSERAKSSTKKKDTSSAFLDDPTTKITEQDVEKIDPDTKGTEIADKGFDREKYLKDLPRDNIADLKGDVTFNEETGNYEYRTYVPNTNRTRSILRTKTPEQFATVAQHPSESYERAGPGDAGDTTDATGGGTGVADTADDPDDVGSETYDAKTSEEKTKLALEGGEVFDGDAMLKSVDTSKLPKQMASIKYNAETGNFEYQKPMAVPMGFREDGTPYPPKYETISLTPDEFAEQTGSTVEDFTTQEEGMKSAKGELSDESEVDGAVGVVSADALADALGVDKEFIKEVKAGTRTVTPEEIAEAAKRSNTPAAEIQQMLEDYIDVEGAKFEGGRPELEAKDLYNLTSTEIAEQTATTVKDAAKTSEYSSTDAAITDFESTVEAAEGTVGSKELVNAKDVLGAAKAVQAIAATDKALNDESVAVAAKGSLSQVALAKASTGSVSPQATVAGQMATLMDQFNDGTPAWAAGAMRAANAAMAARGLGASSMASAAIIQATMEAAVPIAAADAQTFANMNLQNLNNQQQVSLANAAAQQNMTLANLDNDQQVALQNSSNAFALQSQNLSNTQASVLANAQLKSGFQNKTLDIKTQTSLTNAARYAENNNINLNNRQQANLQRSSENLQVEMGNLSNTQQTQLSNLQVRAALIGQELSNEQQMAVITSTQDFERAGFDASAKQQAFLQDAISTAALEGKAMDIRQQTALFNVSAELEERKIELSNEQQASLFNSTNKVNIDLAEMSNRQQTALANAQIDAALEGQELNNRQQTAVLESERYAEAANITFTAEQKSQLHNSELMKTIGIAEMSNRSTIALQNAATIASMDMANLSNEQQAQVVNAQAFLKMDLTNLDNEQQTLMFKAQALQQTILSDTAAENASLQFNATSENQTNQFMASLKKDIDTFNANQKNAMEQFNVSEGNSLSKFNKEQANARVEFNSENALIIAQANAKWRQGVVTTNTASQNEANANDAKTANAFTAKQIDAIWQEERDVMSFAWRTADSDAERATNILITKMNNDTTLTAEEVKKEWSSWSAIGAAILPGLANKYA